MTAETTPRPDPPNEPGEFETRSTGEVLDDHLWQRNHGSLEDDLTRNYSTHVTLLTGTGVYRGHEGVRHTDDELFELMGRTEWTYRNRLVVGEVGFVEWTAESESGAVHDGADSYVIREGRILFQTIHYTVDAGSM